MQTHPLVTEMEAAGSKLGIAPSTVGERAGQGGKFYSRLKAGGWCWPKTEAKVRAKIRELLEET